VRKVAQHLTHCEVPAALPCASVCCNIKLSSHNVHVSPLQSRTAMRCLKPASQAEGESPLKELLDAKERQGLRPLHMAAERGHVPAVNALLAAGASLTAKTPQGNTALHCAAAQGRWGAVRALLSAAATAAAAVSGSSSSSAENSGTVAAAGVKNRQGLTAVQLALKKGLAVPADVLELVGVADSNSSGSSCAGGSSSSISSSSGGDSTTAVPPRAVHTAQVLPSYHTQRT
jgi:Ankyrin repeats (3 copies)